MQDAVERLQTDAFEREDLDVLVVLLLVGTKGAVRLGLGARHDMGVVRRAYMHRQREGRAMMS